jgi:uncharacterized protein
MFVRFFEHLRSGGVPVSLREYLAFLEALKTGLVTYDVEGFYYLARAAMVKDERNIDRFDRAFARAFEGLEDVSLDQVLEAVDLPADWLRRLAEKHLTDEEKAQIEALGGFEKLMETLRERLREQQGRHQGGSKWIGTAGTSPFGAYGYNPEGVRIGQDESRHRRAVKVWDRREFRNLDDTVELGTRNIKVALKRLRKWARDGAARGARPRRHDPGDGRARIPRRAGAARAKQRRQGAAFPRRRRVDGPHVKVVEELFSAARGEFKHLEHFYFHNCLYEGVWRDNRRRWDAQTPTWDVLHTYGPDWKCVFVGDASMSPYEIAMPGGANEHWNAEAGQVWLERARDQWPGCVWINPVPEPHWGWTQSIAMIRDIFGPERMVPMTLQGIERGMKVLGR